MTQAKSTTEAVPRLERWSDRLNPLLVREVRQSMRSRVFSGMIILTACISAIVLVCGILAIADNRDSTSGGMQIFSFLFFILWALGCVVLPLAAAVRFRSERGSGEFELFLITGISARQVVSGKLQAALVQVLLALSVAAPFLMICYLLRGISAVQIAINLLSLTLFTVVLTQCGIMIGVITKSKVVFGLLMLPFFWLLSMSFTVVVGLLNNEIWNELFGSQSMILAFVCALLFLGYYFLLFHLGAVALLEFEVNNRGFPLRLLLLASAIVMPWVMWLIPDLHEPQWFFYALFLPIAVIVTLLVPIPKKPVPRPVRGEWGRGWRRWLRPLFYPDRGSVFIWYALFLGTLGAWEMAVQESEIYVLSVLCATLFLWSMLGNLAGRLLFPRVPTILLSVVGNGVPSLFAVFLVSAGEREAALALCPFTTPAYVDEVNMGPTVLPVLIVVWGVFLVWAPVNFHPDY